MELEDIFTDPVDPQDSTTPQETQDPPTSEPPVDDPADDTKNPAPAEPQDDGLIKYLVDSGVISLPENYEFTSDDKLTEALNISKRETMDRAKDELLNSLPEDFKSLLEYGLYGGNSLKEYMEAFAPKDIDSFDMEDPLDQEQVLLQYYKEGSRFSEDKIKRIINQFKATNSLRESAEEALEDLKTLRDEKKNTLVQKQQQAAADEQRRINDEAVKFRQAIDAYTTTPARKVDIQKLFVTDHQSPSKYNELLNSISSNYDHLLQFADLLLDYDKENGFNFSRFKAQGKSSTSKGLREVLEAHMTNSKNQVRGSSHAFKENFNWETFSNI